jgi:NAD(P)-dependent dehydrogenase (short-subunit alcohol dehydrogenase family)
VTVRAADARGKALAVSEGDAAAGTVKAPVIRLSRSVAEILAGTNVTVNCSAPGPTKSEWV